MNGIRILVDGGVIADLPDMLDFLWFEALAHIGLVVTCTAVQDITAGQLVFADMIEE